MIRACALARTLVACADARGEREWWWWRGVALGCRDEWVGVLFTHSRNHTHVAHTQTDRFMCVHTQTLCTCAEEFAKRLRCKEVDGKVCAGELGFSNQTPRPPPVPVRPAALNPYTLVGVAVVGRRAISIETVTRCLMLLRAHLSATSLPMETYQTLRAARP